MYLNMQQEWSRLKQKQGKEARTTSGKKAGWV